MGYSGTKSECVDDQVVMNPLCFSKKYRDATLITKPFVAVWHTYATGPLWHKIGLYGGQWVPTATAFPYEEQMGPVRSDAAPNGRIE